MSGLSLREELGVWRKVRRLAVPRQMIERATERRLAGDWHGACAAANVGVEVFLSGISADDRAAVADDLFHLAPDLLRWHLPRALPRTHLTDDVVPLRWYRTGGLHVQRLHRNSGNQRLVLRFFKVPPSRVSQSLHATPELWDSRCAGNLTAPADGDELTRLQDAGEWAAAWQLAGFDLAGFDDRVLPAYVKNETIARLRAGRYDLARLPSVIRETAWLGGHPGAYLDLGGRLTMRVDSRTLQAQVIANWANDGEEPLPFVPAARAHRPVDHDLVRLGHLTPGELHPLVAAALFPAHAPAAGPPEPRPDPEPVRVRCHGAWHPITMTAGVLTIPHPPEEALREQALYALGGAPLNGCFAASLGWRDPAVRLPKKLRLLRQELTLRAQHGDGAAVTAWLGGGLDPHVRDHAGRSMLHLLSWLPDPYPVPLLLSLLDAGLDLEARDNDGYPPLLFAVVQGGTIALIEAMLALGARRDAIGPPDLGWERLAREAGRLDELSPAFVVVPGN